MRRFPNSALVFCLALSLMFQLASEANSSRFASLYRAADNAENITIMTFNTYFLYDTEDDPEVKIDQDKIPENYPEKLAQTADVINRNGVDVVGLQEVENRKVLEDLLPFLKKTYAIAHFDSFDKYTGQDVALLYNTEKLELVREPVANFDYSKPLQVMSRDEVMLNLPGQTLSKGILEVELKIKASNEQIVFLVTHLKSQIGGLPEDLKRLAQAHTLRSKMEEIAQTNSNIILMGDMNDTPGSVTVEQITGEAQYVYDFDSSKMLLFRDVFGDVAIADNYTYLVKKFLRAGGKPRFMGSYKDRIDYIFATNWLAYRLQNSYVDGRVDAESRNPSDHRPLITTLMPKQAVTRSEID